MNRPALIWHLILKDLRYQRGLLAMVWLLALLVPIIAWYAGPGPSGTDAYLSGPRDFLALLSVVILLRMIQLDPPGRSIHFLTTRPVDWPSLLASKILFAVAFLLIPIWIETLGPMYAIGMHFDSLDLSLYLLERTIAAAAICSVVAAPAFFLRKTVSALLAIMGGAVLIGIALAIYVGYLLKTGLMFSSTPDDPSYQLESCRWLIFELGLEFTGMAGALFCYNKRPLKQSLILLGSGYLISFLLAINWPIDFSTVFSDHDLRITDFAPALRDKIQFHVDMQPGNPADIVTGTSITNGTIIETVALRGRVSGLEAPYFFVQSGGTADATLRSGRKVTSTYKDASKHQTLLLDDGRLGDNIQQQLACFTLTPEKSKTQQEGTFQVLNYPRGHYRDEDLHGISLNGSVIFTVGRAIILGSLPLHAGMAFNLPRQRYTLEKVKAGAKEISLHIVREYMPLALRGDHFERLGWDDLPWIVINRRKGEYLVVDMQDVEVSENSETYHLQRSGGAKEPLPADWINDAEIVFFSSESCGRISFPYKVPSMDLIQ